MGIPAYLTLSRHGVYYIRWPIPEALHPYGKVSDIKVSLRTRDRREALSLARQLAALADILTSRAVASRMRYDEMRAVIQRHFKSLLDKRTDHIAANGRLSGYDLAVLESARTVAQAPLSAELWSGQREDRDEALRRLQALYGFSVAQGTPEHEILSAEFQRGYRAYIEAVLAHDASFESFTFDPAAPRAEIVQPAAIPNAGRTSLKDMAERYLEEGKVGNQWSAKTLNEKEEHFALLFEVVGAEADVRSITSSEARNLKAVLLHYPKNRNKNPKTRNLPLDEVLSVTGVSTISVKTINTYLAAYSALFKWGKSHRYVDENFFAGMNVRGSSKRSGDGREAFSQDQCMLMLSELLHNERGLIRKDYQKWGPLIALFTGARLGEIAQLHLSDIRKKDDIWCFDLNEADEKQLKTDSSKRLVPVHSKLIEYGFLDYIRVMEQSNSRKLFLDFPYCPKNGWGRSLGRCEWPRLVGPS
ncbi:hypothetical protein M1105_15220 [Limibaculum sp. FT325]|uniref:DUF6538 domain-containing protein n=1 Tax=Thermohalobaculum sediminis TaxID=2939436 RepID=UPI0020C163FD|nr:DUF6538 domain-containing protein [Limibaculum sediminis]MCL5778332.1 hypothetical protein [Limibaculum sediminis]